MNNHNPQVCGCILDIPAFNNGNCKKNDKKKKHKKHYSSSSSSTDCTSSSSSDCKCGKCDKCRTKCEPCCNEDPNFYSAVSSNDCGCFGILTMFLTAIVTPTTYTLAGEVINITFYVTNTGTVNICGCLTLFAPIFGVKISAGINILPGTTQQFIIPYTITAQDILVNNLIVSATAFVKLDKCIVLVSNPATAIITRTIIPG